jgi:lipoprotein-anchoring transpeptidase ErfK/SrfK
MTGLRRIFFALSVALFTSAAQARDVVGLAGYPAGSIIVQTNERQLYFVMTAGQAIRYPVGVGRAGMAWQGRAFVDRKLIQPSWGPPEDIARANPGLPWSIPGGSPNNPMGAAVLGLNKGNYAIHGTNNPGSIGRFVSHGCIRMFNDDIMDLYRRAPLGTQVYVLP